LRIVRPGTVLVLAILRRDRPGVGGQRIRLVADGRGLGAGLVLLATRVLRFHGPAAVALSTLVAAALFNSLRRRVQRTVDRRFNRARYDAEQTVAAFAARLQDHVELGEVRTDLLDVVNAALEPGHLSVWTTPAGPRP